MPTALPILPELYSKSMWGKSTVQKTVITWYFCALLTYMSFVRQSPVKPHMHKTDRKAPPINTKRSLKAAVLKDVHQCGISRPSLRILSQVMPYKDSCHKEPGQRIPDHSLQEVTNLIGSFLPETPALRLWLQGTVIALIPESCSLKNSLS